MHKNKKYTYTGAIRFPVVDKIENRLLKKIGGEKTLRLKTWG